jgi:hypothetical protein
LNDFLVSFLSFVPVNAKQRTECDELEPAVEQFTISRIGGRTVVETACIGIALGQAVDRKIQPHVDLLEENANVPLTSRTRQPPRCVAFPPKNWSA